jgi:putative membrane protein
LVGVAPQAGGRERPRRAPSPRRRGDRAAASDWNESERAEPMKVERLFTEADAERIARAVRAAEQKTSGEIVPVVVDASDHYTHVNFIGATIGQILFVGVGYLFVPECALWQLFLFQAVGYVTGYLACRYVQAIKRLLISDATSEACVYERALRAFYQHELYRTRDRTGILVFVSLLERRVQILADSGINARVAPGTWDGVVGIIVESIRKGDLCQGLCDAVGRCGEILAQEFPRKADDTDELDNRLRLD